MKRLKYSLTAVLVCLVGACWAGPTDPTEIRTAGNIQLRDQYGTLQAISFPTTNIIVLTVADRKGSEQVDDWIAALKPRYGGRVEFRGMADVSGVPGFLQNRVRQRVLATRHYPVMLDWTGKICARLGCQAGLANVLILDTNGIVRAGFAGTAAEPRLGRCMTILDSALAGSPRPTP
jgi:hypothetical protein